MIKISIAKDFSQAPGPRHKFQGKYSGEEFRENFLIPKYELAKNNGDFLEIDLDGVFGYFDSFIEEAFGGLARVYKNEDILKNMRFISNEEPDLINKIEKYIKEANLVSVK